MTLPACTPGTARGIRRVADVPNGQTGASIRKGGDSVFAETFPTMGRIWAGLTCSQSFVEGQNDGSSGAPGPLGRPSQKQSDAKCWTTRAADDQHRQFSLRSNNSF